MRRAVIAFALLALTAPLGAKDGAVLERRIRADMEFLAGEELQGRGSATRDEAIAAAYVASQFRIAGLQPAPGMDGYLQKVQLVRPKLAGNVTLRSGDRTFDSVVPINLAGDVEGQLAVIESAEEDLIPEGAEVLLVKQPIEKLGGFRRMASQHGVRLLLAPETVQAWRGYDRAGNAPRIGTRIEGVEAIPSAASAILSRADIDALAELAGEEVNLSLPLDLSDHAVTTNVIGYLPGTDPAAGVLMLSAHLDHLGVRDDGVYIGANDDASGTAAVIELARALAAGGRLRRGVMFVAYGSEELGLLGSQYFGAHPPIPLDRIAVNLEFELVGKQDPELPPGTLMMTGYERSDFGPRMAAMGAKVTRDPYPDMHFFERSDNFALALRGVVAHTVSGWGPEPNYHTPQDDLSNIDMAFMARAVGSLVEPLRRVADSRTAPRWKPGGKPTRE